MLLRLFDPCQTVFCAVHLESFQFEHLNNILQERRFIFDHEYSFHEVFPITGLDASALWRGHRQTKRV